MTDKTIIEYRQEWARNYMNFSAEEFSRKFQKDVKYHNYLTGTDTDYTDDTFNEFVRDDPLGYYAMKNPT